MFWLCVLQRPVFRCHIIFHAPLDLCMGNRHDALQEDREVLVFRAVGSLAHGFIIAQILLQKRIK